MSREEVGWYSGSRDHNSGNSLYLNYTLWEAKLEDCLCWPGEAFVALAKGLGSGSSTHVVAHITQNSNFQGIQCLLTFVATRHAEGSHTYMQTKH